MPTESERDPQTYAIIGAAMEVHKCLGCGFPEAPYSEALEREFRERRIPFKKEVRFDINYKGTPLVELKALQHITRIEIALAITYLKASAFTRALILNFGTTSLEHRRVVRNFL
jgi:hypothetical protein